MSSSFDMTDEEPADALKELADEREAHAGTRARLKLLERTLMHFVPRDLISFLGKASLIDVKLGDHVEKTMSVVFTDIRDFTSLSESITPQQTFDMINSYLSVMNPVISAHRGIIDKYMGDAIMALFPTTADDALTAALAMLARLTEYNSGRKRAAYAPIRIGIGVNTGLLMLGVIGGGNRMEGTVISHAVNLASRLQTLTKTYGTPLLISEHTLYSLAEPDKFQYRYLGRVKVAYKTHPESIYEVFNHDQPHIRELKIQTLEKFDKALAYYHTRQVQRAQNMLEEIVRINPDDLPAKVYLQRCANHLLSGVYEGSEEFTGDVAWSHEYQLGNDIIDGQHQETLLLLGKLYDAVTTGASPGEISEMMLVLKEQIKGHFDYQEKLMHDIHYPFAADHIAQHKAYMKFFIRLKDEAASNMDDPWHFGFRIKLFLADWLLNHSNRDDRHFNRFLNEQGILNAH
ncbi:MAG: adenylate/guanylate cyclase domain-containing protein [Gallionella sp.]|nr:adenylate/guanylate cyclase domain-containing protein [Gallionella sp.]